MGKSPFEVAESVIGRPKDISSWKGNESECRNAVCVGVLRSSTFIPCALTGERQLNGFRESLENLGRSRSSEKHVRLVLAMEVREGQNAEDKADRLMAAIVHHLEDVIALLRQRNTST